LDFAIDGVRLLRAGHDKPDHHKRDNGEHAFCP